MASFRKPTANKPLKSSFTNDVNNSDPKLKVKGVVGGVIVPNRIFVGGICPKATVDDLASLFRKYGSVTAIKIIADQNGLSKGYGFVTFEKADDVSRLKGDAENLFINNRQLNIAPAIMKNPPYVGRYSESIVMPLTSNLYFTNGLPYHYSEGSPVYPNNSYTSQVAVLPSVSEPAYYPTPYHGAALFYPLSPNTPQIVVGSHQPYSSYQPMHSNNANYAYSSPAPQTPSPPSSTGKSSSLNAPTNIMNATDLQVSQGAPIMTSMPPNMTSLPPPVNYPVPHPPQYYNGTVLPQFSGEMYYNMIPGTCYPMMAVNGQDSYVPYYDLGDGYNSIPSECHMICAQEASLEAPTTYSIGVPGQLLHYQSELVNTSKESVSSVTNCNNSANINNDCNKNSNNGGDTTKALVPLGPPPVTAAPEHASSEPSYPAENKTNCSNSNNHSSSNNSNDNNSTRGINHSHNHSNLHNGGALQTPGLTQPTAVPPPPQQQQQPQPPPPPPLVDYNSSTYIHRSTATAIIYPNAPMPQQKLFFNSVYMAESAPPSLAGQCPYSKNLSEHYVSDHLPKRDVKHTPKKFIGNGTPNNNNNNNNIVNNNVPNINTNGPNNANINNSGGGNNNNNINNVGNHVANNHHSNKDTPPNIPKFPYLLNNNYPGFVNRNMKEKDYKTGVGAKNVDGKPTSRPPRNSGAVSGNLLPKPRIFHNQSQYGGGPPRSQRIDRNGHLLPNMQYPRSGPLVMSRQSSYDQPQPSPYDYANSYHHHHHHHPHPHTSHHHHQNHAASYMKPMGYDSHRRYHQGGNNGGGYRGTNNRYERSNGSGNDADAAQKSNPAEERPQPRKYNQPEESSIMTASEVQHSQAEQNSTTTATATTTTTTTASVNENVQSEQPLAPPPQPQQPQQQTLCVEMQKLTV